MQFSAIFCRKLNELKHTASLFIWRLCPILGWILYSEDKFKLYNILIYYVHWKICIVYIKGDVFYLSARVKNFIIYICEVLVCLKYDLINNSLIIYHKKISNGKNHLNAFGKVNFIISNPQIYLEHKCVIFLNTWGFPLDFC